MISEIRLENFRSIRSSVVALEPLTIFIGANGSGKSNIVKAIEFIAAIPSVGFSLAVSRQGGREGILPKQLPLHDLRNFQTFIGYTKQLPPPGKSNEHIKHVDVTHSFSFSFKSSNNVSISSETLTFNKVLYIGEVLRHKAMSPTISIDSPAHPTKESTFELKYINGRGFYNALPEISETNFENYRSWLGLDRFSSAIDNRKALDIFLDRTQKILKKDERSYPTTAGPKSNRFLFSDRNAGTICEFSTEFKMFLDCIEDTKRYDLLLNELRREQSPSESPDLSKVGQNLPAALRKLSRNKTAYNRLKSTFEAIAPHVMTMRSKSLRTGSEFVEFVESKSGRGIESWEASDGSLRALAILVAVETATKGNTIIIEEPEQNLHPWAIRALIDHVREVISENAIQVIITTHSEHVLERASPEEVLVATRSSADGTEYMRVTDLVKNGSVEMGEIGRLWVKGVLGGVPTV